MGYDTYELKFSLRVSNHNSPQDDEDKQAMEDLHDEMVMLIQSDPRYERIVPSARRAG